MSHIYKIIDSKAWLHSIEDNTFIETNMLKLFNDDILNSEYNIIKSPTRESNSLVGTFSTSQTQRYGKNKRGNTIFMVKPIDYRLPGFLISYGGKLKGKIAIKFKFTNWDSKLPSGTIIDIICSLDNSPDDEIEKILMYHYDIYPKKQKKQIEYNDRDIIRKELDLYIFSIDPDNCEDIDDAMSISINNDITTIGIHIAQPIVYLSEDDILNKSEKNFSTLYLENERKDLWGSEITMLSSLSQNNKKPAYSIFYIFDKNNNIVDIVNYPSMIINSAVLTYDNALNNPKAKDLFAFTNNLTCIKDYHDMVSYWMVKTNTTVGNILKDRGNIPYRINSEKEFDNKEWNLPPDVITAFKSKSINSAEYSFENSIHSSLGVENYCHFTSPIRRIVDTWVHYKLTYDNCKSLDLDIVNYYDSVSKKFHRDLMLKKKLEGYFKDSDTINGYGYIYKIISNNVLELYIPELELFKKVPIYNMKFDYIIIKNIDGDILVLTYDDINYTFKVGDRLKISLNKKLTILPQNKLVINIEESINDQLFSL